MNFTTPISIRLTAPITARLSRASEKTGVRPSELVRVAVHQYLELDPSPEAVIASVVAFRTGAVRRRKPSGRLSAVGME